MGEILEVAPLIAPQFPSDVVHEEPKEITIAEKVKASRGKKRSRLYSISEYKSPPVTFTAPSEKPMLEEQPKKKQKSYFNALQTFLDKQEVYYADEKAEQENIIQETYQRAYDEMRMLQKQDREVHLAEENKGTWDRYGSYFFSAQVAISLTTGIALLTAGTPLALAAGSTLLFAGGTSLAGAVVSETSYRCPLSEAAKHTCGAVALLGSAAAIAMSPQGISQILQIGNAFFAIAQQSAGAVGTLFERQRAERELDAISIRKSLERAKQTRNDGTANLKHLNEAYRNNTFYVISALKEEEDARRNVNTIYQG